MCIRRACATIKATGKGKQIHDETASDYEVCTRGLEGTSIKMDLVDIYAKCGVVSEEG